MEILGQVLPTRMEQNQEARVDGAAGDLPNLWPEAIAGVMYRNEGARLYPLDLP